MKVEPFGPSATLIDTGSQRLATSLWRWLCQNRAPGVIDIVAGARTVLVTGTTSVVLPDVADLAGVPAGRHHEIEVVYDGTDLAAVAAHTGIRPDELAAVHSGSEWQVAFLGFAPGFAYLTGGDPRLTVPRLASPRTSVPAGAVALADGMTAVYPQATPGGWQLIGRSGAAMWDPDRPRPSLLEPGDTVRFEAVADVEPLRPDRPTPIAVDSSYLQVIDPGPQALVQDLGRPGWSHLGVSPAGAADRSSATAANRLVGNGDGAALVECAGGPAAFRLGSSRAISVTGASGPLTVDGLPARRYVALQVPAGADVAIGPPLYGLRSYLAVEGGIDVPSVLGSRSTDTLGGVGPPPLTAGERLPLAAPAGVDVPPPGRRPYLHEPAVVAVHPGPQQHWADTSALFSSFFRCSSKADRTGMRLTGGVIQRTITGELPSGGVVAGAIQIPPDGIPVVLLRNHPTTGGYPVVGVVDDAGLDRLAQCRPGDAVRFEPA